MGLRIGGPVSVVFRFNWKKLRVLRELLVQRIREQQSPSMDIQLEMEKDIQKTIVKYLEVMRIPVSVTNAERVFGRDGTPRRSKVSPDHPDLTCVLSVRINGLLLGLAFYIEVKTPKGSIREGQKEKLRALADAGALCVLARDLKDVQRAVEEFHNMEFDVEAFKRFRTLLELKLSDRRSKEVKDALVALESRV